MFHTCSKYAIFDTGPHFIPERDFYLNGKKESPEHAEFPKCNTTC